MVVRIKYPDGSSSIKLLNNDEITYYGVISEDEFVDYFRENLDFTGDLESWKFTDRKPNGDDVFSVDLRNIFNKGTVCKFEKNGEDCDCEVEIIDINSYEYTAAVLGLDHPENIFIKNVWLEVAEENNNYYWDEWHRHHNHGDEYNDE